MKAAVTAANHHRRYHSLSGLTLLHLRRDSSSTLTPPVVFSSPSRSTTLVNDLESFQSHVSDEFHDLHASSDDLLSFAWIQKLLDSFLRCQENFQSIILKNRGQTLKSPADRMLSELNDRMIKALDVLNGIRDGTDQVRESAKLVEIVLCALEGKKNLCEGHFRRAKKALTELAVMDDPTDSTHAGSIRNRSFGKNNSTMTARHVRSLSWTMSRGWSVAKQIQAIGSNLNHPKGTEMVGSNGVAMAIYTMGYVLLFVMWVLAVAIPCQDHGVHVHLAVPRQLGWGGSMTRLYGRVMDESKKRKSVFLLREVNLMDQCARAVRGSVDSVGSCSSPVHESMELRHNVEELRKVFEAVKDGLGPLERKVRQVFHRIVKSRNEEREILSP